MKPHILLVDDDESIRTGLADNFGREGFDVTAASSGQEALTILGRERFDLVLTDLVMQGMDGMALLRKVREGYAELPIIVITGHGSTHSAIEAMQQGASDYIQKPAKPEVIAARMRSALNAVRLRKTLESQRRRQDTQRKQALDRHAREERMRALETLSRGMAERIDKALEPLCALPAPGLPHGKEAGALRTYLGQVARTIEQLRALLEDLLDAPPPPPSDAQAIRLDQLVADYLASSPGNPRRAGTEPADIVTRLPDSVPPVRTTNQEAMALVETMVDFIRESILDDGKLSIETEVEDYDLDNGDVQRTINLIFRCSGASFDPQDRDRLFDPFFVPACHADRREGDLRLARLHRRINRMGGFIDITGTDKSTTFTFHLPPYEKPSGKTAETAGAVRELVLVIDDQDESLDEASKLLESLGCEVLARKQGQDALELIRTRLQDGLPSVDLVLIDLVLGDQADGVEVFREIRKLVPDQRGILMSGFADTSRITEAKRLGISAHLQKPLHPDLLGKAIRRLLRGG